LGVGFNNLNSLFQIDDFDDNYVYTYTNWTYHNTELKTGRISFDDINNTNPTKADALEGYAVPSLLVTPVVLTWFFLKVVL
jgi:hypothetical protein